MAKEVNKQCIECGACDEDPHTCFECQRDISESTCESNGGKCFLCLENDDGEDVI